MRIILAFTMILFVSISLVGQDIVIEAKDEGTEMVLMATNNEDSDVKVTIELDAKGYDIGTKNKVDVLIPKNETIEVGRYKRDQSVSASFRYGYSLTQTTTSTTKSTSSTKSSSSSNSGKETTNLEPKDESLKDMKGLYVYSIDRCGRCKYAVDFLKSNNIAFTEKNIDENDENNKEAFKYLNASGFEGGSFTTPLIINNGKVSYNIKDLKGFLKELK